MKKKAASAEYRQPFLKTVKKHWILLLMLLPAVAYVIIFSYIPMTGIVLAFKNYQYAGGVYGSPWVGLGNFESLLIAGKLGEVTRNTLLYNIAFIFLGVVFEMGTAVLLNEIVFKKYKKVMQTFMFLPYFISWVVAGAIMYNIFNYERGVFNSLLTMIDTSSQAGRALPRKPVPRREPKAGEPENLPNCPRRLQPVLSTHRQRGDFSTSGRCSFSP